MSEAPTQAPPASQTGLPERSPFARAQVLGVAGVFTAVLIALSARYGYHRDELYFIACGHHLSWGYPDQPVLTPFFARVATAIAPHSLVVLRLPSAVCGFLIVTFTGLTARELGASRRAQGLSAAFISLTGVLLASCHLLTTTNPDLVAWAVLIWLVLRVMHGGDERLWVVAGVVAGIGLSDSDLVAGLAVSLAVGFLVAGPRRLLLSRWLYVGIAIAVVMWLPYLVWQAHHGWPQETVARSIAAGNSGTSSPRWAILPQQFLDAGPPISPFLVVGFVALCRRPSYRWLRPLVVASVVVFVIVTVTGGKAYYLDGLFPLVFAAAGQPTVDWLERGRRRRWWVVAAFVASLVTVEITLPVLPLSRVGPSGIVALNYDAGETIGWPAFTQQIASVYDSIPPAQRATTAILATNYGEAGSVDRFGPALGLPSAYAGQNAFWLWGPPPASATTVVAVGFDTSDLTPDFRSVRLVRHLNNRHDVDDDEQGANVFIASGLRRPWSQIWPDMKDYG